MEAHHHKPRAACIAYTTLGFPSLQDSIPIIKSIQDSGADIIELGVPFSDPMAEGPVIQNSNQVALDNGVDSLRKCFDIVKQARAAGVHVPILLMGYFNSFRQFGSLSDVARAAAEASCNGFVIVDLLPMSSTWSGEAGTDSSQQDDDARELQRQCKRHRIALVPFIAPTTTPARMRSLAKLAVDTESFIYAVSMTGVTGVGKAMSDTLPQFLSQIRAACAEATPTSPPPIAVGFGISSKEDCESIGKLADGVIVGSAIVKQIEACTTIVKSSTSDSKKAVTKKDGVSADSHATPAPVQTQAHGSVADTTSKQVTVNLPKLASFVRNLFGNRDNLIVNPPPLNDTAAFESAAGAAAAAAAATPSSLPPSTDSAFFGRFGGSYVPETLAAALSELSQAYFGRFRDDEEFKREVMSYYQYIGRPSNLHVADRLTAYAYQRAFQNEADKDKIKTAIQTGKVKIWLKREDLNHTGAHKINNAVAQAILAKRLGKKRLIAETGAGQHGVASATIAAKLGLPLTVYMGADDVQRQSLNVARMQLLGATVHPVSSGSRTLKDAINEAMRDWVTNISNTHYLIGSAIGPHPFPTLVRDFQSVIGKESRQQMLQQAGGLPDYVLACVGGGSNSIGMFHPFVDDESVALIGVEAGGRGVDTHEHSATLTAGTVGVLHGTRTYLLQDSATGQISATHSISAGLDYPGVGPEHAYLKDSKRAKYVAVNDKQALEAVAMLAKTEGIIPALETAHAVWWATEEVAVDCIRKEALQAVADRKDVNILVCVSGRGDKDMGIIRESFPKFGLGNLG